MSTARASVSPATHRWPRVKHVIFTPSQYTCSENSLDAAAHSFLLVLSSRLFSGGHVTSSSSGFRLRSIPQAGLGSFHLWIRVSSPRLEPHIPTVYLSSTSIFASLASSLLRICSIRSAILQFLLSARLLSSPSRGRRFVDGSSSPLSLPPGIGPFLAARQSHVNLNQACPVWGTFHLHGRRSG
jgi:hypothetical protein